MRPGAALSFRPLPAGGAGSGGGARHRRRFRRRYFPGGMARTLGRLSAAPAFEDYPGGGTRQGQPRRQDQWGSSMEGSVGLTREALIAEFLDKAGWGRALRKMLAADASFRSYDRLHLDGKPAVLMNAPPPKEDVRPFLRIARHLVGLGYSAPRILAEDVENGLLLLEDLGDATFTRLLNAGEAELPLYQMATDLLIDLHKQPAPEGIAAPYDREKLLSEVALLTDWYAPAVGIELDHTARAAYLAAWQEVLPLAFGVPDRLVLRDFHVDNLMRLEGRDGLAACGLLDFQDALVGP